MTGPLPVIRRASHETTPTRRTGIRERRLLRPEECAEQNVVLIEADADARVEEHVVENSESFFLLQGTMVVFGPGFRERLGPGDFCGFPAGAAHGVEVQEDARFLVVFAPARGIPPA